jgi:beta-glucoside operon transcriptional antiterminator
MYLIYKILNNSAVIARDEKNKEFLVLGKGCVFEKGMYDEIDEDKIMSVFALGGVYQKPTLESLASEIPYTYFEIANEIKTNAEKVLGASLDNGLLLRLADHIHYSRIKLTKGISTPNLILDEIKRFYNKEYTVGIEAVEMINEKLKSSFDENEAGFIAFHIVGSENEDSFVDMSQMTTILKKIVDMIEEYFGIKLDVNSFAYSRLITHLKFFVFRIFSNNNKGANSLEGDSLYEMLTSSYKDIAEFLDRLSLMTELNYDYKFSDTDRMYLLIHLARLLKDDRN